MKKKLLHIIAALMAIVMLCGAFASCAGNVTETTANETTAEIEETTKQGNTEMSETVTSEKADGTEDESAEGDDTAESYETTACPIETDSTDTISDGAETTDETDDNGEHSTTEKEEVLPKLEGPYAPTVTLAESLKNQVNAGYTDGTRENVFFENKEMYLQYALSGTANQQITTLTDKNGNAYIEDTMDVFVRMVGGETFYASNSYSAAVFNIYRFGYYYYQMRLEGQTFVAAGESAGELAVNFKAPVTSNGEAVKGYKYSDGKLKIVNYENANDPWVVISNSLSVPTETYTMLEITLKADDKSSNNAEVFYVAGSEKNFNGGQRITFNIVPDGKEHTYRVPLYMGEDFTGNIKALRLDLNGSGATFEISSMKFVGVDVGNAPKNLFLCRNFNIYSDKMHHVLQIAATEETANILEVGTLTRIDASTVAAVVVEDKNGIHYDFEGIDWDSAEYVGFDIIDAGIFGYILPYDGKGGKIKVELEDGVYVIEQTMTPEGGRITPSRTDFNTEMNYYNWVEGGNANDFYMGQRIYTDANHSFDEFLFEAYCERNPLISNYVKVYEESSDSAKYVGYDSLRGIYRFNMSGAKGGFSTPYYEEPNRQYRASFLIRGDKQNRQVYVMTHTTVGQLESAVLLDGDDVMLPVPLEVGKNFSEQSGERNLYNLDDATYGEVIFPLVIAANEKYEYTVVNLYQNWGNYPLKQLSWIQFFSPYYHLSTGVTETNCVLPWMFTDRTWYNTLPDHRGMSAPHWTSQPQHTSSGEHDWLRYVDSDGNIVRWENVKNTIDSYGPTYADVKMDYITYDGKMKVSYTHTEMPQTDENRTYYEMTYEVLEDITINNFVTDFQFYKVDPNDNKGIYQKVGYLNEQNQCVVVNANKTTTPVKYVLGNECPYFSFFDMDNHSDPNGYGNLAFLVYESEFIIGGEAAEPSFAIVNHTDTVYVTLNIEEQTTLKAGDKFIINAILLPWGSHLLEDGKIDAESNNYEYSMQLPDGSLYMDKNVRDVRENTLLNPITAIAGANCETIESVFVPKVKSTNGVSAEFTLTGGYNNVAVRVYGFNKMTVPVIYELVDDEWVVYDVSSQNAESDPHKYDGYCIHYDGDGSFSYSFVTDMDGKTDRTFKVVADGNYTGWKREVYENKNRPDYLELYVDPQEIVDLDGKTMLTYGFASSYEIMKDEGSDYLRIFGGGPNAQYAEGYSYVLRDSNAPYGGGKYLAVKYRFGADNAEKIQAFEFYMSTEEDGARDNTTYFRTTSVVSDGQWHILIIDLSKVDSDTFQSKFVASDDGKYYPQFIRFDFFDRRMATESYFDIAFVGMDSDIANIVALAEGVQDIKLVEGSDEFKVDPTTGNVIGTKPTIPQVLVDPSSGYTQSTLQFGAELDNLNGTHYGISAGSKTGIASYQFFEGTIADSSVQDSATVSGYKLVISGWCVVEGGVDRYVWSADGGKTWNNIELYSLSSIGSANSAMIDAAGGRAKNYTFSLTTDIQNGGFQGNKGANPTGIAFDLEAYKGQTVDIIFAAVPAKDTTTILPLYYIGQIKVAE